MKFHIVSMNETVNDLLRIYSLNIDELKEANKHIRDFNHLRAGTRLKIPTITETIDQDILDMEPFIEDYYPRKPIYSEEDEQVIDPVVSNEEITKVEELDSTNSIEEINEVKEEVRNNLEDLKTEKEVTKTNIKENEVKTSESNQTELKNHEQKKEYIYIPVYYPIYIYVKK